MFWDHTCVCVFTEEKRAQTSLMGLVSQEEIHPHLAENSPVTAQPADSGLPVWIWWVRGPSRPKVKAPFTSLIELELLFLAKPPD